jgi:hypothetical protein
MAVPRDVLMADRRGGYLPAAVEISIVGVEGSLGGNRIYGKHQQSEN